MEGFNIGRFLFLPGRKVFGVLVESELKPEVLKEIADLGFRHGVLVPTIQYNIVEGKIVGFGFADLTNADTSIEELAKKYIILKASKKCRLSIQPSMVL